MKNLRIETFAVAAVSVAAWIIAIDAARELVEARRILALVLG